MDYLIGVLGIGVFIALGVIIFLFSVVIIAWIIRIGVQWGIMKSMDHIENAVREAILSTKPDKKEKDFMSRIPKMGLKD